MTAVGWPRATSSAKVGPDSTAAGRPGSTSATTSVMDAPLACSIPLEQITTGVASAK